jgi:hypothetical protein
MAAPRALPALLALAAAVALLPQAAAQAPGIHNPGAPTPVTLYMHLIDLNDFPINTQEPDDHWTVSNAWGLSTSTTTCLPDGTPGADLSQEWHTFYGYSSPSYVEYAQEEGGKPRLHNERGISYDALLDPATPFTLYWYLTSQSVYLDGGGAPNPSQVPVPVPHVSVSATIRSGDLISVDDRAYNTGEVLVQGRTPPATLLADQVLPAPPATAAPPQVKALGQQDDGSWLYEFAVPMSIQVPVIPRATGYNLRVDVSMDNPACADADHALMPNVVRVASVPGHRPRMEFAVTDPLRIDALHPQFVGDDLVVHAAVNAVWGNYDVGEPSVYTPNVTADDLRLTIVGPSDAASLARVNLVSSTHPHYMHQEDVTVVYVWPYKVDAAVPGTYRVHLEVGNDQHTARATADTEFEVGRGGGNRALNCTLGAACHAEGPGVDGASHGAPSPGVPLAAAGLAAVAVAVRRRRDP